MIRLYTDDDYEDLKRWSLDHGVDVFPPHIYRVGLVDEAADGEKHGMVFVLMSNAGEGIAFIEWLTMNPANSARQSAKSEEALMGAAQALAKEHNYGMVVTHVPKRRIWRYKRKGWIENHEIVPIFKVIKHDGH